MLSHSADAVAAYDRQLTPVRQFSLRCRRQDIKTTRSSLRVAGMTCSYSGTWRTLYRSGDAVAAYDR